MAWLYDRTAHLGFNIIDEGLVMSYTHRILAGQVPHRDFISPRPVGSSILHIPDLLIPLPAYLAGRLVGITTVVVYSVLIAWIVYRRPPTRWGAAAAGGAAVSALVNLHTMLETQWYTFDGLLLSAAGFIALEAGLRRENRRLQLFAFLLAGVAVTTKQSFAPAPVAMLVWLGWEKRALGRVAVKRELLIGAVVGALPMLVYVGGIAVLGGGRDVVDQLTSGHLVWGRSLFEILGLHGIAYGRPPYTGHFAWEVAIAAAAVAFAARRRVNVAARIALAALLVILAARFGYEHQFDRTGSWSLEVTWAFILTIAVAAASARRLERSHLLVLLLAWMAMLSWGYDVPALVAGSMLLVIATWAFNGVDLRTLPFDRRLVGTLAALVAVAAIVFTAERELSARRAQPYFDRAAPELTQSIGRFSSDLRGLKTSRVMVSYLQGLQDCRRRYPSHWTAVLPDNPGLYHALGMRNPFPIDWFFRQDYRGQLGKIVAAARKLEAEGNYLVLFQTVAGPFLNSFGGPLPNATRRSPVAMLTIGLLYDTDTGKALVATLHGRHVVCGSFLGIWSPRS